MVMLLWFGCLQNIQCCGGSANVTATAALLLLLLLLLLGLPKPQSPRAVISPSSDFLFEFQNSKW